MRQEKKLNEFCRREHEWLVRWRLRPPGRYVPIQLIGCHLHILNLVDVYGSAQWRLLEDRFGDPLLRSEVLQDDDAAMDEPEPEPEPAPEPELVSAAAAFDGPRDGCEFKRGAQGVGYYRTVTADVVVFDGPTDVDARWAINNPSRDKRESFGHAGCRFVSRSLRDNVGWRSFLSVKHADRAPFPRALRSRFWSRLLVSRYIYDRLPWLWAFYTDRVSAADSLCVF